MIGSTLAPFPLFDPEEMTGDLRDEWELPGGDDRALVDEHSDLWKKYRRTRASAVFHRLLHHCGSAPVTLPKTSNE